MAMHIDSLGPQQFPFYIFTLKKNVLHVGERTELARAEMSSLMKYFL